MSHTESGSSYSQINQINKKDSYVLKCQLEVLLTMLQDLVNYVYLKTLAILTRQPEDDNKDYRLILKETYLCRIREGIKLYSLSMDIGCRTA